VHRKVVAEKAMDDRLENLCSGSDGSSFAAVQAGDRFSLADVTEKQSEPKLTLAIYRCSHCGDTFPAEDDGRGICCPSCGNDSVEIASEPLL
jgi:rubrerythrin